MSTKTWETYVVFERDVLIPAEARHSPDVAASVVRTLKSNRYRYIGDGSYFQLEAQALKIAGVPKREIYNWVLGVFACDQGAILNSYDLCRDSLIGGRFHKRFLRSFPKGRLASICVNDQVGNFGFAFYEPDQPARMWEVTSGWQFGFENFEEAGSPHHIEEACLGRWDAQHLPGAKPSEIDDEDDGRGEIVVGGETFEINDIYGYFDDLTGQLEAALVERSCAESQNRFDSISWFVRRPWWSRFGT